MNRVLFSLLVSFLFLAVSSFGSFAHAANLTCAEFEKYEDQDYFETVETEPLTQVQKETLIRKAAAAFLAIDTSVMPFADVEAISEEPWAGVVKDPNGNLFFEAQIGFGGGNSISYYFEKDTLELLPIANYDGTCTERGTDPALPLEEAAKIDGSAVLTCSVSDPNSPVQNFAITVNTEAGAYTGDDVTVSADLNPNFEDLTVLAGANRVEEVLKADAVKLASSKFGTGASATLDYRNSQQGAGMIILKLIAREKSGAKVSGRFYKQRVGGYWDKDAYDFDFPATCLLTGTIASTTYKRILKY